MVLEKGIVECVFEKIGNDMRFIKIQYFCMGSNNTLTFELSDDEDRHLLTENRFVYNTIYYDVGVPGIYALCFKSTENCNLTLTTKLSMAVKE